MNGFLRIETRLTGRELRDGDEDDDDVDEPWRDDDDGEQAMVLRQKDSTPEKGAKAGFDSRDLLRRRWTKLIIDEEVEDEEV